MIVYVEDYRIKNDSSLSDTETIRNAVSNLTDGDTLVFKARKTYVLDEPVSLLQYYKMVDGVETVAYKSKKYLTIDGNGCTVRGSNSFLEAYGHTGTNNKNALFYTSDDAKHGMTYCIIKNFKFKWAESTTDIKANESIRNMGLGVVTSDNSISDPEKKSVYFSNGIIEINRLIFNFPY